MYESERSNNVAALGNTDFQSVIRRSVQKGQYFKAYPTCFGHLNLPMIVSKLKQTLACEDVVMAEGGSASHFIRVKIFQYPEGVVSLWVIIAVICDKN